MNTEDILINPKVFISYSWDDETHKSWIQSFASQLRRDGIDVTLDVWHALPGIQLTEFMERAIIENDFVLIICTPKYKIKSDTRKGGVGYEGNIITGEIFIKSNHLKYIPILRHGSWETAAPSPFLGKYYINLSPSDNYDSNYQILLQTLYNKYPKAPSLGKPLFNNNPNSKEEDLKEALSSSNTSNAERKSHSAFQNPKTKYKYIGTLPILNEIEQILYENGLKSLIVYNQFLIHKPKRIVASFLFFFFALILSSVIFYHKFTNDNSSFIDLWFFIIIIFSLLSGWSSLMFIGIDMVSGFIVLQIPLIKHRIITFNTLTDVEVYYKNNNRLVIKFLSKKTIISFNLTKTSKEPAILILNMVLNHFNRNDVRIAYRRSFLEL